MKELTREVNQKHECPICNREIGAQTNLESEEEEPVNPLPRKREGMEGVEEEIIEETREEPWRRSRIGPSNEMYIPMSSRNESRSTDPLKLLSIGETSTEMQIDVLKNELNEVVLLSKLFLETGFDSANMVNFLKACEIVKSRIETIFRTKAPVEMDDTMKNRLQKLKTHLREVIDITKEFRNDTFLSPSVENFARICEDVDDKINICMKRVESQPVTDVAKSRLFDLKSQIKDVVKITENYKEQGLLASSAQKFLKSCEEVKSKIDLYTKETVDNDRKKLDHLKKLLKKIEDMAIDVKQEGLTSPSIENFLTSCKEFKDEVDDNKNRCKPLTESGLNKLLSQLDETIILSRKAKQSGLVSESVDKFITSCEDIIMKIKTVDKAMNSKPQSPKVLEKLEYNIDDVMRMVNKCQSEGLVTKSIEDFIKSLEMAKAKIDTCKKHEPNDCEFRIIHPSCSNDCTCGDQTGPPDDLCVICKDELKENPSDGFVLSPSCSLCQGIVKEPSEEVTRDLADFCCSAQYSDRSQDLSGICDVCKKYMEEAIEEAKPSEPPPEDSSLGYFEKNIRKITKVTRTQNTDGTIREEKVTITIKKEKHDPTETSFGDDEDDKYVGTASYKSLLDESVATCLTPEQNQEGFLG